MSIAENSGVRSAGGTVMHFYGREHLYGGHRVGAQGGYQRLRRGVMWGGVVLLTWLVAMILVGT